MLLGAVADDVTGATDLCSVLVRGGMRTLQTIGVPEGVEAADVDAVVVALKSRTAPAGEAVEQSVAALRRLRALGAERFFFKICSTFDSTPDGNIGPVADALLDELGADSTLVTPAYPANGRTVYMGHLFVGERLLSETSMREHPLTPMTDSNLVRVLQRQTRRRVNLLPLHAPFRLEPTYTVADAITDDDLRALGAACTDLPLLVGGAGLALGLPRAYGFGGAAAPASHPAGPAVVIAGSCSAVTLEQVRRMAERYPAVKVDEFRGYDGETLLVYSSAPPEGRSSEPGDVIEAKLAEAAKQAVAAGARRIVVAGGETSGAVMQALGVRALAVGAEIAPGVPWMTWLGDPPLAFALKSGNFGGPDFFLEAVA
jgi:3-dehydrotetronate 4-kinase